MPDGEERIRELELENELLALENEALRTELESGRPLLEHPVDDTRLKELIRAEKDLKRLLRRLGRGATGWMVRRLPGYRMMADRHLGDDE